jgi:hypothetical protein
MALEGLARSDLIDEHLVRVWSFKDRLPMMHREGWTGDRQDRGTTPFAWFVFYPQPLRAAIELRRISWKKRSDHEESRAKRAAQETRRAANNEPGPQALTRREQSVEPEFWLIPYHRGSVDTR